MANSKAVKFGPVFAWGNYTVKVRGESGCSVVSTLAMAEEQAACYLSSRPAGVVDVFYSEQCRCCSGAGRVVKSRKLLAWKPCPACNGAPELYADELVRTIAA